MREKRFTEEQIIARPTRPSPRSPGAVIVASTIEWTPDDIYDVDFGGCAVDYRANEHLLSEPVEGWT